MANQTLERRLQLLALEYYTLLTLTTYPYKEKMEELREQLMKSAQIGQGLLAENQELKSRSKEDTEQVRNIIKLTKCTRL